MDKDEYADAWNEGEGKPAEKAVNAAQQAQAEDEKAYGEGWGLSPDTQDAPKAKPAEAAEPAEKAPAVPFKEAFAAARKGGAKTFEWNGKQYTTELKAKAQDKPAAPAAKPVAAPAAPAAVAKPAVTLAPIVDKRITAPGTSTTADAVPVNNGMGGSRK